MNIVVLVDFWPHVITLKRSADTDLGCRRVVQGAFLSFSPSFDICVAARNVRFVYWGRLSYCLFVWIYVVVSILKSPLGSLAALQTEPPNWKMFNHVGLQPAMIFGPQTFLSNPSSHHPIIPSSHPVESFFGCQGSSQKPSQCRSALWISDASPLCRGTWWIFWI